MTNIKTLLETTKRLCAEATPGPWHVDEVTGLDVGDGYQEDDIVSRGIDGPDGVGLNTGVEYQMYSEADAAFISHARTALPALVEEVERLQAIVEPLTDYATARDEAENG